MKSLRWSSAAAQDLEDIWVWIASGSPASARRVTREIIAATRMLAAMPGSGHIHEHVPPHLRVLRVRDWLVIHYETDTAVELVRIVSGRRDLRLLTFRPPG